MHSCYGGRWPKTAAAGLGDDFESRTPRRQSGEGVMGISIEMTGGSDFDEGSAVEMERKREGSQ